MKREYKEILLLKGMDNLTDEELDRFKFFLPDEFNIPNGRLEAANRSQLVKLMIQSDGEVSALMKTISIVKKLQYMDLAKCLQEEKEKVDKKYMENEKKNETKLIRKKNVAKTSSAEHVASGNDTTAPPAAPGVSPPVKKQVAAKQEAMRQEGLQEDPMTVMVLKAMKPFKFESRKGQQEMFHATVATDRDFYFVKVFDTRLTDKFHPKKIITISKYYWHSTFLEVNTSSLVLDAESDQKVSVPNNIIRKAGKTPKIRDLQTRPLGTIVNGVFMVQEKTEKRNGTLYGLNDNTGSMNVLVLGNQNRIKCEKGDKLRLTFFELSKYRRNLQLVSGSHSHITVIKAKKNKGSEMKKKD
ncbi:interferon-inducible protein AIM2 isoform X2 [Perognathus longimembris pacificus]|nr:interferon-inducible protein AIM2 isoform X2 [Perognathus longimembris pacificus]